MVKNDACYLILKYAVILWPCLSFETVKYWFFYFELLWKFVRIQISYTIFICIEKIKFKIFKNGFDVGVSIGLLPLFFEIWIKHLTQASFQTDRVTEYDECSTY